MTVAFKFFTAFVIVPVAAVSSSLEPNHGVCHQPNVPPTLGDSSLKKFSNSKGVALLKTYTNEELSAMSPKEFQEILALANERIRESNEVAKWQALTLQRLAKLGQDFFTSHQKDNTDDVSEDVGEDETPVPSLLNMEPAELHFIVGQVANLEPSWGTRLFNAATLACTTASMMGKTLDALREAIIGFSVRALQLEEELRVAQTKAAGNKRTVQSLKETVHRLTANQERPSPTQPASVDTV